MRLKEENLGQNVLQWKKEKPHERRTGINIISYAYAARVYFLASGDKLDQRFVQSR
jgi:hypothetical protein